MKHSGYYNVPVDIRSRSWEEEEVSANLYEDILEIIINKGITVSLIPGYPTNFYNSFPEAIMNSESVSTREQAYDVTLLLSFYSITPNNEHAGETARLKREVLGLNDMLSIFYVSENEFKYFVNEANQISQQTFSTDIDDLKLINLTKYRLIQFIMNTIFDFILSDNKTLHYK